MPLIVADREVDESMESLSSAVTELSQSCRQLRTCLSSVKKAYNSVEMENAIKDYKAELNKAIKKLDTIAENIKTASNTYLLEIDEIDDFLY